MTAAEPSADATTDIVYMVQDWMPIGDASRILGITGNALKDRVLKSKSMRGLPPRTPPNETGRWMIAWEDVAVVAAEKGMDCPQPPSTTAPTPPEDAARIFELEAAVQQLRTENADLRAGYELAAADAQIARADELRARTEAAERRAADLEAQLAESRADNTRLRNAIAELVVRD